MVRAGVPTLTTSYQELEIEPPTVSKHHVAGTPQMRPPDPVRGISDVPAGQYLAARNLRDPRAAGQHRAELEQVEAPDLQVQTLLGGELGDRVTALRCIVEPDHPGALLSPPQRVDSPPTPDVDEGRRRPALLLAHPLSERRRVEVRRRVPVPGVGTVPSGAADPDAAEPAVEPAVCGLRGLEVERRVRDPPARTVRSGQEPVGVRRRRQRPAFEHAGPEREDPLPLERRPDLAHEVEVPAGQEAAEDVEASYRAVSLADVDLERGSAVPARRVTHV